MYDPKSDSQDASGTPSGQRGSVPSNTSAEPPATPAELQTEAVILKCAYCRKEFDRASTKSMPFCSPRCQQIDLGLWLNEVHSMPYEIDPGIS